MTAVTAPGSRQSFRYKAIDTNKQEIRLLRLACKEDNVIGGETFITAISHTPPYSALSYAWGSSLQPTHSVEIDGQTFEVQDNLYLALTTLVSEIRVLVIWVDAICIDQHHIIERNHQVGLMKNIYQNAESVIAWLGPRFEDSDLALQAAAEIYTSRTSEAELMKQVDGRDFLRRIDALAKLLQLPYWRRVWVVQEMVLAKTAVAYCGSTKISMISLTEAQKTLTNIANRWSHKVEYAPTSNAIYWNGPRRYETTRELHQSGDITVYQCLEFHLGKEVTDPRDMIYGFMGLVSSLSVKQDLMIDYGRSVGEVYTDFARYEVINSQKLDILTKLNHEWLNIYELPSWVPDWFGHSQVQHVFLQHGLTNFKFVAAGESTAKALFLADQNVCVVSGLRLGRVTHLGERTYMDNIYDSARGVRAVSEWLSVALDLMTPSRSLLLAIGKALYGGYAMATDKGGMLMSDEFILTTLGHLIEAFNKVTSPSTSPWHQVWRSDEFLSAIVYNASCYSYSENVFSITPILNFIWDRRFFYCSARDNNCAPVWGIAPQLAAVGDIVAVLFGCSEPMVLRPDIKNNSYTVIGAAYVDSFMQGKAMELFENGELLEESFELH